MAKTLTLSDDTLNILKSLLEGAIDDGLDEADKCKTEAEFNNTLYRDAAVAYNALFDPSWDRTYADTLEELTECGHYLPRYQVLQMTRSSVSRRRAAAVASPSWVCAFHGRAICRPA